MHLVHVRERRDCGGLLAEVHRGFCAGQRVSACRVRVCCACCCSFPALSIYFIGVLGVRLCVCVGEPL